jgi:hypothetical protein
MSAHLTHEELTDNLLGVSSLTVNAHLMNCPTCTGELERMKRSISEFRGAAQAWSESPQRTANAFSVVHAAPKSSWRVGNWMLVAAVMVMFAAGLTFYMHNHQNPDRAAVVRVATAVNTVESPLSQIEKDPTQENQVEKAQLEKDNELLSQVDSEIAEAVPAPMQPLRLMESTAVSTSTGKK